MGFFSRLSIAGKLVAINMLVVLVALVCALSFLVVSQRNDDRRQLVSNLHTQTLMMANHLTSALQNNDRDSAERILSAYRDDARVREVILFDSARESLAHYMKPGIPRSQSGYGYLYGGQLQWPGQKNYSVVFSREGVLITQRISLPNKLDGGLFVHLDLEAVRAGQSSAFWLLVFGVTLIMAWLLVRRMVVTVTEPIPRLLNAMYAVRNDKNFSVRIDQQGEDELGALAREFNNMLVGIGERDAELSKQHLKLELEVQERTQELRKANEDLASTVKALQHANRAIRISEENKRLAEASATSKAYFLANMSHELRTPMNGVLGMISLLNDTELSEEQKEYLHVAYESGHVLLDLINNVLDLSKIEQGKLVLENIDFNLVQSVEEALAILGESAQAKGLELAMSWQPEATVQVSGDPVRFKQLIVNLVGNAIRFTDSGFVSVSFRLLGEYGERRKYRFEVTDTGIGIREDVRDVIFEKFAQADTSTTREYGGSGLGLALCRQLTRLMDGTIGVESEYGHGSTFWFEVFFREPLSCSLIDHESLSLSPVLILEPSQVMRASLVCYLRHMGVKAKVTGSVEGLLAELETDQVYGSLIAGLGAGVESVSRMVDSSKIQTRFRGRQIILIGNAQQRNQLPRDIRLQHSVLLKPVRYQRLLEAMRWAGSLVKAEQGTLPFFPELNPIPVGTYRVLIVEDNVVNQQVARGRLEKMGYSVKVAENGAAALALCGEERFDLIFMDCQMPVLDGYQATRRIRKEEQKLSGKGRTPIIAMTAHALAGDRDQCIKAGMDDYVAKPFRTEELKQVLERWLKKQD